MGQNPNEHYYIDKNGLLVFTEKYHLERGYCCHNGCRHCPYGNSREKKADKQENKSTEEGE